MNSPKLKDKERLEKKLNYPRTESKTYLPILKKIVNGSKIPPIQRLLFGNQLDTNFVVKANLFIDFFSHQCTTLVNNNPIPTNPYFESENRFYTFGFSIGNIIKVIKILDPNNLTDMIKYQSA